MLTAAKTRASAGNGASPDRSDRSAPARRAARRVLAPAGLLRAAACWAVLLLSVATLSQADPGVTATEIKIGNTVPLSGPASATGAIATGFAVYFKKINDAGGVNGRTIDFMSYDDGYSPPRTYELARRLIEQDHVLALVGTAGTPTNTAIWRYMNEKRVPQLFIMSGASKFNDPKGHPWTMPWLPSYEAEAAVYARYIVERLPKARIGILYQNDDFGKEYLRGFYKGLGPSGRKLVVLEQSYETTDPTVDSQVVNLKNSGADVFLDVTVPKFAAQAIKKAYALGWRPLHFLSFISASIGSVLKPAGLDVSKDIVTVQFLKDPADPRYENDADEGEYLAAMRRYAPRHNPYDPFVLWGYSAAAAFTDALRRCGADVSRGSLMRKAASLHNVRVPMLLPGIVVDTSAQDFQPIRRLHLARFDGARWVLFGELYDTAGPRGALKPNR